MSEPSDPPRARSYLLSHTNIGVEGKRLAKDLVRRSVRGPRGTAHDPSDIPLQYMSETEGRPIRVAIARADGLGDWILTIPLIEALQQSPYVGEICLVAPSGFQSLLKQGELNFLAYDLETVHRSGTGALVSGRRLLSASRVYQRRAAILGEAERGKHDLVVLPRFEADTGINLRAWAVATGSRIAGHDPRALLFAPRSERREWQAIDFLAPRCPPAQHEISHLQTMMRTLGLPTRVGHGWARGFFGLQPTPRENRLVIHPSAARGHREWPLVRWADLILTLTAQDPDLRVSLIGGAQDRVLHKALASMTGPAVESEIERTPLAELPRLINAARWFAGSDSGPAHLAGALGTPTVVVSPHPKEGDPEHSNSPIRYRPWSDLAVTLQPDHALPPCRTACGQNHTHCIAQIGPDEVVEALASFSRRLDAL